MCAQDPVSIHANEPNPMPEAAEQAKDCFETVLGHGLKIEIDHYLVYTTRASLYPPYLLYVTNHHLRCHLDYELARLYARMGDSAEAKRHLELVISGKPLETNVQSRKGMWPMSCSSSGPARLLTVRIGKYSLENAITVRAHAALDALEQGKPL